MTAENRPVPAGLRGTGHESFAATKPLALELESSRTDDDSAPTLVSLPLPWAAALIRKASGDFPEYGSPEWAALDDRDARKVAACVAAAECWRTSTDPAWVEWRLRSELEGAQDDDRWSSEVVAEVHRTATRPSYAELSRRRGEPVREQRARQQRHRLGLVPSA